MGDISNFEKDGSVLAWLRAIEPGMTVEFAAIDHLTDAPVETKVIFVKELSEEVADPLGGEEEVINARLAVVSGLGYVAGYYGPASYRQKVYSAWQEAEPDIKPPFLQEGLYGQDISEIARNN